MRFAAKRFLTDKVGDPAMVLALFSAYGLDAPQIEAVRKWYQRDSISVEWFPLLLVVMEINTGKPVSLKDFINE